MSAAVYGCLLDYRCTCYVAALKAIKGFWRINPNLRTRCWSIRTSFESTDTKAAHPLILTS